MTVIDPVTSPTASVSTYRRHIRSAELQRLQRRSRPKRIASKGERVMAEVAPKHNSTSAYQPRGAVARWIERRLPIGRLFYDEFIAYPTPRNLNLWWTFGAILTFMLGVQIATGIVLAMHYTPDSRLAFDSVEH